VRTTALVLFAIAWGAVPVAARTVEGVDVRESITVAGVPLTLNGTAVRVATVFNIKVWVGALYLPSPARTPEDVLSSTGPIRLDLTFLRSVSREQVFRSWKYQFKESVVKNYPGRAEKEAALIALLGPLKPGSVERFEIVGDAVRVFDGGVHQGTIEGREFRDAFLSMWVGERPPTAAVKNGFLGKGKWK